jgi:hypothetical protein
MDDNDQQPQQHVKFATAATTPSKSSSLSSTTPAPAVGENSVSSDDYCLKCKKNPILFECDPCGCPNIFMVDYDGSENKLM